MTAPSPGWYPDPTTSGKLRFYDGDQWTKAVVGIPENGQLTPDMIAVGRKIMQDKAAAQHRHRTPTQESQKPSSQEASLGVRASSRQSAHSAADAVATTDSVRNGTGSEHQFESPAGRRPGAVQSTPTKPDGIEPVSGASAVAPALSGTQSTGSQSAGTQTAGTSGTPRSEATGVTTSSPAGTVQPVTPRWATASKTDDSRATAFANDAATTGTAAQNSQEAAKASEGSKRKPIFIGAAVVALAAVGFGAWSFFGDETPTAGEPSAAYKELGLKENFGCKEVSQEVIELSKGSADEIPVTAIADVKMTADKRSEFELPKQQGKYTVAFECEGTATYDGETQQLSFDMSADKSGRLWTYYVARDK